MTIHSFHIFDRHCNCIYDREYSHSSTEPLNGSINKNNNSNSSQLLFGILYSLKTISSKLVDKDIDYYGSEDQTAAPLFSSANVLKSFSFGQFRIHYFESLTQLKFIIISDNQIDNLQNVLWELYSKYYLKNVVQNTFLPVEFKIPDDGIQADGFDKINNSNFINETDGFIQGLPAFLS